MWITFNFIFTLKNMLINLKPTHITLPITQRLVLAYGYHRFKSIYDVEACPDYLIAKFNVDGKAILPLLTLSKPILVSKLPYTSPWVDYLDTELLS